MDMVSKIRQKARMCFLGGNSLYFQSTGRYYYRHFLQSGVVVRISKQDFFSAVSEYVSD